MTTRWWCDSRTSSSSRASTCCRPASSTARHSLFVSDYFDFSIYVDADVEHIRRWYVERFFTLRETAFRDPRSYFHRYASLSDDEAHAPPRDLVGDQRAQPLREHPADQGAGRPHPAQGGGPRGSPSPPAPALTGGAEAEPGSPPRPRCPRRSAWSWRGALTSLARGSSVTDRATNLPPSHPDLPICGQGVAGRRRPSRRTSAGSRPAR